MNFTKTKEIKKGGESIMRNYQGDLGDRLQSFGSVNGKNYVINLNTLKVYQVLYRNQVLSRNWLNPKMWKKVTDRISEKIISEYQHFAYPA